MKFKIRSKSSTSIKAIFYFVNTQESSLDEQLNSENHKSYVQKLIDQRRVGLFSLGDANFDQYVFISKDFSDDYLVRENLRKACVKISDCASEMKYEQIALVAAASISADNLLVAAEAIALASYRFNQYKTTKRTQEHQINSIHITHPEIKRSDLKRIENRIQYVNKAKDLVNTPNLDLGVKELGTRLEYEASRLGLTFTSFSKKEIKKRKMGGLLGVNAGSPDHPGFFVIEYKPKESISSKPLVLVGKGVVYDTGGYSLKPSASMLSMKSDMAGAAAAANALFNIAANEYPIHAFAIIPSTDNRVEKKAIVPDDILRMSDGTTVEVQNTDAEGRLILADALVFAKSLKPELVIDFATLTGAAAYLTGFFSSAFFSKANEQITQQMILAGDLCYERLMQLPLWDEYADMLKSTIADMRNIGGRVGGMITAAKFLEHFTDYPWMHIDIAGPAYLDNSEGYRSLGGTGVGVRLIDDFINLWAKESRS